MIYVTLNYTYICTVHILNFSDTKFRISYGFSTKYYYIIFKLKHN